jgi:hypothetical protein
VRTCALVSSPSESRSGTPFEQTHGRPDDGRPLLPKAVAPLKRFGQEINAGTFTLARMNAFLHDMEADIQRAKRFRRPIPQLGPS